MRGNLISRGMGIAAAIVLFAITGACDHLAAQPAAIISAAPNPVPLGGSLTLAPNPTASNPVIFTFTAATVVTLTLAPAGGAPVLLCGLGGATCTPGSNGTTLSILIPTAPALLGNWNLTAVNPFTGATARLPGSLRIGNFSTPTASAQPPVVSDVIPRCVTAPSFPPFFVSLQAIGKNFDPNAQAVVSYIYFVDKHVRFRTDFHGQDSRVQATITSRSATSVGFFVDLQQIHNKGGDPFGLAGNYYVQIENPNGKVSGGLMYFTVRPYHGPGIGHC